MRLTGGHEILKGIGRIFFREFEFSASDLPNIFRNLLTIYRRKRKNPLNETKPLK